MLNKILEQIFPTTCGICGKIYKESICNKCKKQLDEKVICKKQIKYICGEFVEYMYMFKYESDMRKILLSYKFNEKNYLYDFFAKIILKNEKMYHFLEKYDIMIPVPIHYKKYKKRGYNQCELISKKIAENIPKLQYRRDVLSKIKNNLRQSSLSSEERKDNVKGVYQIKNFEAQVEEMQNKNILIFDDICTTGNTIKECTKILKELNPKNIGIITIFKN